MQTSQQHPGLADTISFREVVGSSCLREASARRLYGGHVAAGVNMHMLHIYIYVYRDIGYMVILYDIKFMMIYDYYIYNYMYMYYR